jgi:hypothetical protein
MPLNTPQKIAHVQAVTNASYIGRQKTVVFVYNSAGMLSYVTQQVIFRPQNSIDPQIPNLSGGAPGVPAEIAMIAPLTVSFSGVMLVADTTIASAVGVAAAAKYEIIEAVPTGIIPGGTHYAVALRRLR